MGPKRKSFKVEKTQKKTSKNSSRKKSNTAAAPAAAKVPALQVVMPDPVEPIAQINCFLRSKLTYNHPLKQQAPEPCGPCKTDGHQCWFSPLYSRCMHCLFFGISRCAGAAKPAVTGTMGISWKDPVLYDDAGRHSILLNPDEGRPRKDDGSITGVTTREEQRWGIPSIWYFKKGKDREAARLFCEQNGIPIPPKPGFVTSPDSDWYADYGDYEGDLVEGAAEDPHPGLGADIGGSGNFGNDGDDGINAPGFDGDDGGDMPGFGGNDFPLNQDEPQQPQEGFLHPPPTQQQRQAAAGEGEQEDLSHIATYEQAIHELRKARAENRTLRDDILKHQLQIIEGRDLVQGFRDAHHKEWNARAAAMDAVRNMNAPDSAYLLWFRRHPQNEGHREKEKGWAAVQTFFDDGPNKGQMKNIFGIKRDAKTGHVMGANRSEIMEEPHQAHDLEGRFENFMVDTVTFDFEGKWAGVRSERAAEAALLAAAPALLGRDIQAAPQQEQQFQADPGMQQPQYQQEYQVDPALQQPQQQEQQQPQEDVDFSEFLNF